MASAAVPQTPTSDILTYKGDSKDLILIQCKDGQNMSVNKGPGLPIQFDTAGLHDVFQDAKKTMPRVVTLYYLNGGCKIVMAGIINGLPHQSNHMFVGKAATEMAHVTVEGQNNTQDAAMCQSELTVAFHVNDTMPIDVNISHLIK